MTLPLPLPLPLRVEHVQVHDEEATPASRRLTLMYFERCSPMLGATVRVRVRDRVTVRVRVGVG